MTWHLCNISPCNQALGNIRATFKININLKQKFICLMNTFISDVPLFQIYGVHIRWNNLLGLNWYIDLQIIIYVSNFKQFLWYYLFILILYCLPDVNECKLDQYDCDERATCINTIGSYVCRCIKGYTGPGKKNGCWGEILYIFLLSSISSLSLSGHVFFVWLFDCMHVC